ncbi:thiamine-phosphate kinase [Vulcaniibacterium thermophilum]|uniref:Thiamine-monophosphate kinase n=1 Tax=Vulcaniibacterium thermophilum TaxID=1169913 RepID=A0A919DCS4_9GAMM|nr:thiamine-phosphate kinase [Vulcaniibacterium thermophilum]GHE33359.1 thiamine-monophosphate kinase [Vulcaniibacterium thermophilum]
MAEFSLIERIRRRAAAREDVVLGIGDDAALLRVPPGRELAVAMDTLNAGVHFPDGTAAADVGWKALAVNLSDLAAMGAEPAWCTLSLSLPQADAAWLDGFLDGFLELAAAHRVALVGGDTTRGPLSVCVTVHGLIEPGSALRRDGARVGDAVWVSGTLGDAAGALRQWQQQGVGVDPALRDRLDRPTPRVALGRALRGIAHAAIDVSDGLLADLGHVCTASGLAAEIELDALPCSAALAAAFDRNTRRALQAAGGDDYELCFTAPAEASAAIGALARALALPLARIGRTVEGAGVRALTADGTPWQPARAGYEHFG